MYQIILTKINFYFDKKLLRILDKKILGDLSLFLNAFNFKILK